MARFATTLAALTFCTVSLLGCGAEEPMPPEPAASQAAAQESASKWTPEQMEKFGELNREARGEGEAGKGVTEAGEGK
jgi:hypothetical protein